MDTHNNDKPVELTINDLDAVIGGSWNRMMTLITQLLQMKHEGPKGIVQNMRA